MRPRRPKDSFFKGHGLGNVYIVLERANLSFPLTPGAIRLICDPNFGLGSDGIALFEPSRSADCRMRILNPDGSEAQKSGNGARIFALYLSRYVRPGKKRFVIETAGGTIEARLSESSITVDMGKATFASKALPMRGPAREAIGEKIRLGREKLSFVGVSVGNPHAVFFMKGLSPERLRRLGPLIEHHRMFPERTNVQFVQVLDSRRIRAIIWERGAGETASSGSSACAVAAAGRRLGRVGPNAKIVMRGGSLNIGIRPDWRLTMTGPAREVATGRFSRDFLASLRRAGA